MSVIATKCNIGASREEFNLYSCLHFLYLSGGKILVLQADKVRFSNILY